ncbi:MAG: phosphatidylglycerophosphatase A [candidate division NC10 bacterium]|nr:phosphatidylglycerophosphatase A [candidate division NC10 bacterium]
MGERKRATRAAVPTAAIPPLPWAIATVGGLGRVPLLPGTAGSLLGAALCLPFLFLLPWPVHVAAAAVLAGVAIWASGVATGGLGERDLPVIVIDEAAGMLAAGIALPATMYDLAAAFLLFRLFDVVKPGPLERLERLPGGWGIVLDDLAAGLLARATWWLLKQNFEFL